MRESFREYTDALRHHTGYTATWLPTTKVELGDVGILSKHGFQARSKLSQFDIEFDAKHAQSKGDISYKSSDSVHLEVKVAGGAPIPGSALQTVDAGLVIRFDKASGVVFQAHECRSLAIADLRSLEARVIKLWKNSRWSIDNVIVTEVVKASTTTVLISGSAGAVVELRTAAEIAPSAIALANVNAGFSLARESQMATSIIASGSLTPLFRAVAVRRRLFRPDVLRTGSSPQSDEASLRRVEYGDFISAEVA